MLGEVLVVDGSREVGLRPVERRLLGCSGRSAGRRWCAMRHWPTPSGVRRSHARRSTPCKPTCDASARVSVPGSSARRAAAITSGRVSPSTSTPSKPRSTLPPRPARPTRAARWDEALSLWRGTPFEEIGEWAPAESERVRLVELWHRAEEELCAAALATSPSPTVVAEAERLAQLEPLRERRWALLMTALHATGRRAEALRTFDRARRTLATELGISPGNRARPAAPGPARRR